MPEVLPITASIVLYQTPYEELVQVIHCVQQSCIETLYLIDNSPTDALRHFFDAQSFTQQMVYQYVGANLGYGGGHNQALRHVLQQGGAYHLVLNSDLYFAPELIANLRNYMDAQPQVALCMPKVLYPDGRIQYQTKLLPTPMDMIFRRFLPKRLTAQRMERFLLAFTNYDQEMNVPFLSGCFMFLRLEALREVGIFDERYFIYAEDLDLSRRLHEKYQTIFLPQYTLYHTYRAASRRQWRMFVLHLINQVRYFNKWGWFCDRERIRINQRLLDELQHEPDLK